jgi:hypothetical protein
MGSVAVSIPLSIFRKPTVKYTHWIHIE